MKNRKNYVMTSTPTLTQSGLLAELLRCHRRKAIEMTQRRTLREQGRGLFENSFSWLRGRAHNIAAGRRFLRGFGEATIPGTLESSTKSISS
jgi:hypothetical protein